MDEKQHNPQVEGTIRKFRAVLILIIACAVLYFVYTTTMKDDSAYPFKLGLDLAGGTHLVYEADVTNLKPEEVPELMSVLREVIERRVNLFGVSEPLVQVERSSRVAEEQSERLIVELPGVTDIEEAVKQIGQTPLLEFKLLNDEVLATIDSSSYAEDGSLKKEVEDTLYVQTDLTGRYLARAELVFGNGSAGLSNEPIVSITFNTEGADLFEKITRENTGKQLAIFLDGSVLSSPVINEPITGGKAVITGDFTPEVARELVHNLNFGALPMPISLVSTQSIGASLGERAIDAGIKAGVLGLIAVGLFMIFWYRLPGFFAALSLSIYLLMMLAIFKLIPVTLTAAGLAGLILSIGLAVDANILISERLRDELRKGKQSADAIREGFSQAWTSIRDGNFVNILSGVILYWFGDVFIEGFAFTLIIGTIVSLISSLVISRTFLLAFCTKTETSVGKFLMGSGITK